LRLFAGALQERRNRACRCNPKRAAFGRATLVLNPGRREALMTNPEFGRRDFLKGAVVGGAAAATTSVVNPQTAESAEATGANTTAPAPQGYSFFNLDEAAFVEALVDHMVPADDLTPSGTDLGLAVFIDRALGGAWARATGSTCRVRGSWARRVKATSCR
jgi:hypothetical protein